jgi:hypothetical protein
MPAMNGYVGPDWVGSLVPIAPFHCDPVICAHEVGGEVTLVLS